MRRLIVPFLLLMLVTAACSQDSEIGQASATTIASVAPTSAATTLVAPGTTAAEAHNPASDSSTTTHVPPTTASPSPGVGSKLMSCDPSDIPLGASPPQNGGSDPISVLGVTLNGGAFFDVGPHGRDMRSGCGFEVDPESIFDGLFFPRDHPWDEGPVWWNSADGEDRWIEVTLDRMYLIRSVIVQTDNNDTYLVSYRDPDTGVWEELWAVPNGCCHGMQTHPNPDDANAAMALPTPTRTDTLRVEATSGDDMYSIAELQLYGVPAE